VARWQAQQLEPPRIKGDPTKVRASGKNAWFRAPAGSWAVAGTAVAAAVLLRWLLDSVLGDTLPLVTLFGAVAAAVWVGGWRVAVAGAVVGYGACALLFIEPRGFADHFTAANAVGFVAYLFTCGLIIGLGETMRVAQARASAQGELLRVTLRSIGDAVVTTDVDGRVTYLNEVAQTLTGWTQREAHGQPLETVFHIVNEATRKPVESPATRALREGVVVGLANHTVLIQKDGAERPIDDSAAPIRDESGRVSGCVLIFRDVAEHRRLERERDSQLLAARTLAAIVESSEAAIIGKSLDGTIRSWNAAAERLFGYSAADAIGRHISLVIPPDRMAEEEKIIASLASGDRIEQLETERVRADGGRVLVSLTISPIKDGSGNVVGASKIVRDITGERQAEAERLRLESNLRALAADLSAADRRKDEFLATLSHELRSPLAPLANVLEIWKRSSDPQVLEHARATMERQLGQMVRLVDDLLDLNRITHDRFELRRSRVDLVAEIRQAVDASRPLADSLGHEIAVDAPAEPVWVHADSVRLAQVFGNLLNNACKYTNAGGRISVAVRRDAAEAVVSVADTGTGIPPDQLDAIFDMFTQVARTSDRVPGGMGIGLALVKRLVQMHGGSITATSAGHGRGSEFVVRLPLAAAPQVEAVVPAAAAPTAQKLRVLVVDDNADAAFSLAMLLQIAGHETYTAHDGTAAVQAAEEHRPDIALLDIGLPHLNGHDVCRHIRAQPWGDEMLLIALTGWGQDEDRRKSHDAGFDGHLVKPVDYQNLATLLQSFVRR
jgi:PAS domain S-box-containing protein